MNNKKNISYKLLRFWKILGPGLVTGASDDDPSGIATYSQAGAAYGLSTLWTALITFPLMASIQEMCARIGLVTSHGLAGTLKTHYSKPVLYLMLLFSFPAIVMNIGADIAGMGAVGNLIGFCVLLFLIHMGISMLPYIGGLAGLILDGALQLGAVIFFLTFIRAGQAEIGMLFAGFKNFGTALAAYLLVTVFVFLWSLLLIIPGIIAALAYSQTFYLLADNPALGPLEAIRMSKEIMRGYKGKLFCLGLRYFCWALLCLFTFGIGFIFLVPYMFVDNQSYPPVSLDFMQAYRKDTSYGTD
jgi:uncharacterized membrane protein